MTDQVRRAVADLSKTIREIRESTSPATERREEGDYFSFSTPGRLSSTEKKESETEEDKVRGRQTDR